MSVFKDRNTYVLGVMAMILLKSICASEPATPSPSVLFLYSAGAGFIVCLALCLWSVKTPRTANTPMSRNATDIIIYILFATFLAFIILFFNLDHTAWGKMVIGISFCVLSAKTLYLLGDLFFPRKLLNGSPSHVEKSLAVGRWTQFFLALLVCASIFTNINVYYCTWSVLLIPGIVSVIYNKLSPLTKRHEKGGI